MPLQLLLNPDRFDPSRVAEVGSLSASAKMALQIFDRRKFAIFGTKASRLRVIANLIQYNMQYKPCNSALHPQKTLFLTKKNNTFLPKVFHYVHILCRDVEGSSRLCATSATQDPSIVCAFPYCDYQSALSTKKSITISIVNRQHSYQHKWVLFYLDKKVVVQNVCITIDMNIFWTKAGFFQPEFSKFLYFLPVVRLCFNVSDTGLKRLSHSSEQPIFKYSVIPAI